MPIINFEKLTFQNFRSYGNVPTTINFNDPGATLILGENLDDTSQGVSSNGTGKSTLIEAFVYGVYGKSMYAGCTKADLINNINGDSMDTAVEFTKGKDKYVIKRGKVKGKSRGGGISLLKNSVDITPDSITNTDIFIEKEIIGIPFDIFVRVVVFSAINAPFLNLPLRSKTEANQSEIIEELFDLKQLSVKAGKLKKLITDTERSLEIADIKINEIRKQIKLHKDQLQSAKTRFDDWDFARGRDVKDINGKLKKIEGVDIDEQKKLYEQLDEEKGKLKYIQTERRQLTESVRVLKSAIDKLNTQLTHLADKRCPFCLQKFKNAQSKIEEIKKELDEKTSALTKETKALGMSENTEGLLEDNISDLKSRITVGNLDEIIAIKSQVATLTSRLDQLVKAENPHLENYEELMGMELEPLDTKGLDALSDELEHQKFLLSLLTKRDSFLRRKLLERNLPYLNLRLSEYLEHLRLPHIVRFTSEMTVDISKYGKSLSFGSLSTGQKARLNLALAFSFRDVLHRMYAPVNICLLDEVLDYGLDDVGVAAAVAMIKNKARVEKSMVYIISHNEAINGAFDRVLTVQMKDGFSYVV